MKSEHRHDLQTNELGKFTEKVGGFMEVHGNRLMIGVCVVSLAASGVIYWVRTQKNSEAAAWREVSTALATNKAEDFNDVWAEHKGTTTGLWARVHEGERRLGLGVQELFRNVEAGREELKKAQNAFQTVVDDRHAPAEVRERGLIGLGRTLESLSEGNEGEAVKTYEMLVKEFPESLYKNDAQERIVALNKGSGQEFYAWFAKYQRPKAIEKSPHDKFGAGLEEDTEKTIEEIKKLHRISERSGGKPADEDSESPELPETGKTKGQGEETDEAAPGVKDDKADKDEKAAKKDSEGDQPEADSKPEAEPKPDPVSKPESTPEADEKASPE